QFSLLLALFLSGYAVIADLIGSVRKDTGFIKSGNNATGAALLCLTTATAALLVVLLKSDFRVIYVAAHTARSLPLAYKISALWAGAPGSLLLWLWLQVAFVVFVFCKGKTSKGIFASHGRAIANLVSVFFLLVMIKDKNPFEVSTIAPVDGAGLNPLLQHPAMVLHPPILFIGYAAFAIPFAWAVAALKYPKAETSIPLLEQSKRWTLVAWVFLTAGILLGAWWAYEELGWGGYWAWDPVENSSLMPWLTGTALVHCFRAFHSRGKTLLWAIFLSLITFSLCVFGTFLTRSGIVASVHAFSTLENVFKSPIFLFIVLLIHIWIIAGFLAIKRHLSPQPADFLPYEGKTQTYAAYNNYLMLFLTFVIFFGTLYPLISGIFGDQEKTLEPAYFNKITAPGGFILILFIGICPYLWRYGLKMSWRLVLAVLALVASGLIWFMTKALAPAILVCSGVVFLNLVGDLSGRIFTSKAANQSKISLRWVGARVVHLGVALIFLGIAGSGGYGQEGQFAMVPGQQETIGRYTLVYEQLRQEEGPNFTAFVADVMVYEQDQPVAKLAPAKAVYSASNQSVSEVDIRRTLGGDLYLALTEMDLANERINLRVLIKIKPLINWIWIGSGLMVSGAVLALAAMGRRRRVPAPNEGIQ
ncbi:MAG: heme lyase CcmF/NrfE family subunit, partial [Planctomycetota bacterium]